MSDFKVKDKLTVYRGLQGGIAKLDHVASFTYKTLIDKPELPVSDKAAELNWGQGMTWYPYADIGSEERMPDDIIEKAQRVAIFVGRWVALRFWYINPDDRRGYYRTLYFPPRDVFKPFEKIGAA